MALTKKKKISFTDLSLGKMPVVKIKKAIDLDIEEGNIVFSSAAQKHSYHRHTDDFPHCLTNLSNIITNPQFIGDDFNNEGKIELINRVPSINSAILVSVTIEKDSNGNYNVCSMYLISEKKIQNRLEKGFLKRVVV